MYSIYPETLPQGRLLSVRESQRGEAETQTPERATETGKDTERDETREGTFS